MSNVLAAFSERKGASHARAAKAAAVATELHDAEVQEIKEEEEVKNRKLTMAQKRMRRVMAVRKLSNTTANLAFVANAGQSLFSPGGAGDALGGEVTANPMSVFLRRFQRKARVGLEALLVIPRDRSETEQRRAFHFLEKHPPMKQFWKRFAVPSAADRAAFSGRAHIYQYLKARKKLFAEGMPDLFIYVVLFGQIGLIVRNHDGTSQQVAYKAGPGAILGAENCVFEMLCAMTAGGDPSAGGRRTGDPAMAGTNAEALDAIGRRDSTYALSAEALEDGTILLRVGKKRITGPFLRALRLDALRALRFLTRVPAFRSQYWDLNPTLCRVVSTHLHRRRYAPSTPVFSEGSALDNRAMLAVIRHGECLVSMRIKTQKAKGRRKGGAGGPATSDASDVAERKRNRLALLKAHAQKVAEEAAGEGDALPDLEAQFEGHEDLDLCLMGPTSLLGQRAILELPERRLRMESIRERAGRSLCHVHNHSVLATTGVELWCICRYDALRFLFDRTARRAALAETLLAVPDKRRLFRAVEQQDKWLRWRSRLITKITRRQTGEQFGDQGLSAREQNHLAWLKSEALKAHAAEIDEAREDKEKMLQTGKKKVAAETERCMKRRATAMLTTMAFDPNKKVLIPGGKGKAELQPRRPGGASPTKRSQKLAFITQIPGDQRGAADGGGDGDGGGDSPIRVDGFVVESNVRTEKECATVPDDQVLLPGTFVGLGEEFDEAECSTHFIGGGSFQNINYSRRGCLSLPLCTESAEIAKEAGIWNSSHVSSESSHEGLFELRILHKLEKAEQQRRKHLWNTPGSRAKRSAFPDEDDSTTYADRVLAERAEAAVRASANATGEGAGGAASPTMTSLEKALVESLSPLRVLNAEGTSNLRRTTMFSERSRGRLKPQRSRSVRLSSGEGFEGVAISSSVDLTEINEVVDDSEVRRMSDGLSALML